MDKIVFILTRYGTAGVAITAFFEAIFFPPPVEIILLPVMLANPDRALLYALMTVMVSLLGSIVGYNLGRVAGHRILARLFSVDKIEYVKGVYDRYGVFAVITSAVTPVPYEVYTLSAGAFSMNFSRFIAAAFFGRLLRYIPEGAAVQFFGYVININTVKGYSLFAAGTIILIAIYLLWRKLAAKTDKNNQQ